MGAKGGESHVKLSINEMPSHTHTTQPHSHHINLNTAASGNHVHLYKDIFYSEGADVTRDYTHVPGNIGTGSSRDNDNVGHQMSRTTYSDGAHVHNVQGQSQPSSVKLDAIGGNLAHENRPPYYVVQYIIYAPTTIIG